MSRVVGVVVGVVVFAAGFVVPSAYAVGRGAPLWAAALIGAAVFPLLPIVWHVVSERRRGDSSGSLTAQDRFVLRALGVLGVVIVPLMVVDGARTWRSIKDHGLWLVRSAPSPSGDSADPKADGDSKRTPTADSKPPTSTAVDGSSVLVPAGERDPDLLSLVPSDAHAVYWMREELPYGKTIAFSLAAFFDSLGGISVKELGIDGTRPGERIAAVRHDDRGGRTVVQMHFVWRMTPRARAAKIARLRRSKGKKIQRAGRTMFPNGIGWSYYGIGPTTLALTADEWLLGSLDQMTGSRSRVPVWRDAFKGMPSDANVVIIKRRTNAYGNHVANPDGIGFRSSLSIKATSMDLWAHWPSRSRRGAEAWKNLLTEQFAKASAKLPVTAKAMKRLSFVTADDGLTMVGSWPRAEVEAVDAELLVQYRDSPDAKRRAERKKRRREREQRRRRKGWD